MGHEAAIVQRLEGKTIDDKYLELVATEYGEYIAFIGMDGDVLTTAHLEGGEEGSLQNIKDTMAESTTPFTLLFGKGCTEEDRQPYMIMKIDNLSPLCGLILEGNFSGFGQMESTHPDEWYVSQQYILPKLTRLAKDYDENEAKIVEYLQDKFNQDEMLKSICPLPGARCEILFIFSNGQTVNMIKGDLHKRYDWGEVSQALTYNPTGQSTTLERRKGSLLSGTKTVPIIPQKPNEPSVPVTKPGKDTAISAALNKAEAKNDDDRPYILPPGRRCQSAKDLGDFYMHNCGYCPEGWDAAVKHPDKALPGRVKKALWNDQDRFDQAVSKGTFLLVKGDKAPAKIDAPAPINRMVLLATEREAVEKVFKPKLIKATIDDGSNLVADPVKLAEDLKDNPLFTQMAGFKDGLDEFEKYSSEAFLLLCRTEPKAAALLLSQYRLDRWANKKSGAAAKVAI
jgi:hypothetical protein